MTKHSSAAARSTRRPQAITPDNITGRDGHIILQALATACALMDNVPEAYREVSSHEDLCEILAHRLGPNWRERIEQVRHVLSAQEWLDKSAALSAAAPEA